MTHISVIDVATGIETITELTQEEIDLREAEAKAWQSKIAKEAKAQEAIRSSALAKLAALGLTADEVASL